MSDQPTNYNVRKIVIFASGSGSNTENIIRHFENSKNIKVAAVFSNKRNARVLRRAYDLDVQALYFDRDAFYHSNDVLHVLKDIDPDLIVLAGFLWMVPKNIIENFPNRIINVHPALLPNYGGKGMYGMRVHEAIITNKEKESGITIHFVNEHYDEGEHIFQAKTIIETHDSPESLASKINELEHHHFPLVIEKLLQKDS
ncbi:phosphoribosylglycinamide formyltransferase [Zunongwangia profunda]|uniref:Phosphoribosylglycinamide formyltransferase n=1 Tax=Zunongwangia profunda TaxID=398743 RepID=A0A3D5J612_9FLAO|nr:phosphoribosylglycinamide formyltransferase [Zunongwangia profunda]MAC65538.1 phosphoribosylglycinamide formyltransferase [Flavobacteriaceae bacterium]MAS69883.1 phosphoribosylglycinamide formyltransferase [Zunongwangia sp.]MAG86454.1 phosphoribosylglycinamide formyltransferase [Flavobacteriaceae bacterium]MCC4228907.1 phosphoribosylglycinamide formyltransferase [Zunongwangia profunda]HAJ81151.1 phosphoribosylglycinamide formyltransferase [Zunongwangia profunda]